MMPTYVLTASPLLLIFTMWKYELTAPSPPFDNYDVKVWVDRSFSPFRYLRCENMSWPLLLPHSIFTMWKLWVEHAPFPFRYYRQRTDYGLSFFPSGPSYYGVFINLFDVIMFIINKNYIFFFIPRIIFLMFLCNPIVCKQILFIPYKGMLYSDWLFLFCYKWLKSL